MSQVSSSKAGESNTLVNEKAKDVRQTNIIAAKGKLTPQPIMSNLVSLCSCRRCRPYQSRTQRHGQNGKSGKFRAPILGATLSFRVSSESLVANTHFLFRSKLPKAKC